MAHLISTTNLKALSYISSNVDDLLLSTLITRVQDTVLESILGSQLFNRLLEGVDNNDLTADQLKIVEMINNGESYGAIVKAINKGATYVSRQLVELEKLGMIKGFELTPKGKTNVGEVSFEVVYKYEEREGIPPLIGNSSRPFCKNLMGLKKVFTREEIDKITAKLKANGIDRNVWEYKGGWYTNPETGVHTPSCRHTWYQIIVNK